MAFESYVYVRNRDEYSPVVLFRATDSEGLIREVRFDQSLTLRPEQWAYLSEWFVLTPGTGIGPAPEVNPNVLDFRYIKLSQIGAPLGVAGLDEDGVVYLDQLPSDLGGGGESTPDATTSIKGKIKLAGDLAGTADLPTVPSLSSKIDNSARGVTIAELDGDGKVKPEQTRFPIPSDIGAELEGAAEAAVNAIPVDDLTDPSLTRLTTLKGIFEETAELGTTGHAALHDDVLSSLGGKANVIHAEEHAIGGIDPLAPADIGAASIDDLSDAVDALVDNAPPEMDTVGKLATYVGQAAEAFEGLQDLVDTKTDEAYVDQKIEDLVDGADEALNTLKEIGDRIEEDEGVISGLLTSLGAAAMKSANLSDLADLGAARDNLGLGDAYGADFGTGSNDVPRGNDARFTDARTPTAHTHPSTDVTGLGDAATKNVGTTSGTVAAGDDSRFTNSRTPTSHKSTHATGGSDALIPSDIGAAQASHTHPSTDITGLGNSATRNVGSTAGTVAAGDDSRLYDARTPTSHKSSHYSGGSDPLTPSDIGAAASSHTHVAANITDLGDSATRNVGTGSGTVAAGNDSRFTDSRTPVTHNSTHATGGSDPLTPSDIGAAASSHTHVAANVTDLGNAATKNTGTTSGTVAMGDDGRFRKSIQWNPYAPNGTVITGDGQAVFRVGTVLNNYNLTSVGMGLITASSSGTVTVQLRRRRNGVDVDMLSTRLTIDATKTDTTASGITPAVIDNSYRDLQNGDLIFVDVDGAGTGAIGLIVTAGATAQ